MKRKKHNNIIAIMIVITLILLSIKPVSASVCNQTTDNKILYISSEGSILYDTAEYTTLTELEMLEADISEYEKVIIDSECLDSDSKNKLLSIYNSNARILIIGDITTQSVRAFFDMPEKTTSLLNAKEDSIGSESDIYAVDVSTFASLGVLVYKDPQGTNITDIKIENINDTEKVSYALDYCMNYDYISLVVDSYDTNASTRAYNNSWSNVDVNTSTYVADRCTITTSLKLDKNTGNPNSSNEYLQYTPYIVEVDVEGSYTYSVSKVEIETKGGSSSLIYDYGPLDQDCGASASVSFSLPYSISVSFTPASKVAISKVSGGIDSNSVVMKYQPKNVLGINGYEYDGIRCEAHIEAYQSNNSTLEGYGQFNVYTYEHDSYSGDPSNLIRYYNSGWDTVSGT